MNNKFIDKARLWPKISPGLTFSPQLLKYCVAMKLFILTLIFSLNVSASVYSQKINLSFKNAPLREVMQSIRKQSGYNFLFNSTLLNLAKPVTVALNEAEIEATLQTIFADQPFTYTLENKIITLKRKEEPGIFEKVKAFFKSITFTGKVIDEEGLPLPGAVLKAGNRTTATNARGEFSFSNLEEGTPVQVSFVGYTTVNVTANSKFTTITLKINTGELDEVVINKGYYTTTKELNTGNVSTVSGEIIRRQPVGDPLVALTGRVAGLSINQTTGIPGSEVIVRLRGQNSIANGNNPLYIVDGVPFTSQSLYTGLNLGSRAVGNSSPFSTISLSDIESIDVLKDADATAIYGSRGANGVILITTKKGKQGLTKVNVNVSQGFGKVTRKLDLMNTEQYLAMRMQAYQNDGVTTIPTTDYDVNGTWDKNSYTDWQKAMIGGTAKVTNAQASVSGGNENTQFIYGGAFRRETTVFPGDYNDRKGSAFVNLNHKSENNRFHTNLAVSYLNDNNRMPITDFTSNILLAPNAPALYNADGSLNWQNSTWTNPFFALLQKNISITNNLNSSLGLDYQIIKGLKISTTAGYNDIRLESTNILPATTNPAVTPNAATRRNLFGNNGIKTWIIEPKLSYNLEWAGGKLESLVGATFQQNDLRGMYQSASGFSSNAIIDNLGAATTLSIPRVLFSRYRYNAIYARIGYNYADEFILNLTGRRDGSSRFGPGKQFGNFGAIGAGWIFSKEKAVADVVPFLSFGKLRASYGLTGNDQLVDYAYLSTYSNYSGTYQGATGLTPTQLTNPEYGWETVKKLEFGLELGLLKDRILFNTSIYRNRTGNQLVGYSLPSITGFTTVTANLPAVIQNSGIEFELTTRNFESKDFNWTTTANFSIPRNKLVSFPNLAASSYATQYIIGQPLSLAFRYQFNGINPTTGLYTFEDVNKDGQTTFAFDRKPVFVGQKFYGGLNNNFSYKGFQLDVFLQFVKQNGYNSKSSVAPGIFFASSSNQLSTVANDVQNKIAQPYTSNFSTTISNRNDLFIASDGVIINASYIRLKNVQLSWTLPAKIQHALTLSNTRVYIQGQNLLTFTKYKGLDPETFNNSPTFLQLPALRMMTVGLDVNF